MQIREQGRKIQLIRTHYIAAKKRTEGKVFGRFEKHLTTIPDSIRQQLSKPEVSQLENYLSERRKQTHVELCKNALSSCSAALRLAAKSLAVPEAMAELDTTAAQEIFEAISRLKKALRKSGFHPVKPKTLPISDVNLMLPAPVMSTWPDHRSDEDRPW